MFQSSGRPVAHGARRGFRLGAIVAALASSVSFAQAQQAPKPDETTLLDRLVITFTELWTGLGTEAEADTGTTVLGPKAMALKSDARGDANSALRNLPNVQYQNDGSRDAGRDGQDEIDLKPMKLSISGGRVNENNFRLNGIGINNVTGSEEPFATDLGSYESTPNANAIYGLHPQTVFVPSEFVDEAILIDSNASARYGDFLGGVVDFKLAAPPEKLSGMISVGGQTDDFVSYHLGTDDGFNLDGRKKPEFGRYKTAAQVGGPITDTWSFIAQYSREGATTNNQKDYRYFDLIADQYSVNAFYRLANAVETDHGTFTLEGAYTDYDEEWDGFMYRDTRMMKQTKGLTSHFAWDRDLESIELEAIGLKNVHFNAKAFYNHSDTINDGGSDIMVQRNVWARSAVANNNPATWFFSTDPDLLSWCRVPLVLSGTSATCREGGLGYKEQSQQEKGLKADIDGDVLLGKFAAGFEYRRTDAHRMRTTHLSNGLSKTLIATPIVGGFKCAPGDPFCTYEQYASNRTTLPGYDNSISLDSFDAYAELDQSWEWLNVRAGLRLDYESFFGNLNLAPRVVATVTPVEDFAISAGYNRYYAADAVDYAIRDGIQLGYTETRTHLADGTVPTNWTPSAAAPRFYQFSGQDLDTPYIDEFAAGLRWVDPWAGGTMRLRYIDRQGRDQYMAASGSTSTISTLTNDGTSEYRSAATIEYGKSWDVQTTSLNTVSLLASLTWEERRKSSYGYYDDEWDNRIWYGGASYNKGEFSLVTGNLDIPVRTSLDLNTEWLDGRLDVGLSGNLNLGYMGVRDTDTTCTPSPTSAICRLPSGDGVGVSHKIYSDFEFKPVVTVDMSARYRLSETKYGAVDLEFAVENLFDETGNAEATEDTPWLRGRSFWIGSKATF